MLYKPALMNVHGYGCNERKFACTTSGTAVTGLLKNCTEVLLSTAQGGRQPREMIAWPHLGHLVFVAFPFRNALFRNNLTNSVSACMLTHVDALAWNSAPLVRLTFEVMRET